MQASSDVGDEHSSKLVQATCSEEPQSLHAEDGQQQCQRCKRTNVQCIFEKHRRGRKPGSKLSEASKMLRRLEKGLNTAKLKQAGDTSMSSVFPAVDSHSPQAESQFGGILRPVDQYIASVSGSRPLDGDEEDDRGDEKFPAKLIRRENSFFRTILNPEHKSPYHPTVPSQVPRSDLNSPQQLRPAPLPVGYQDPITAELITEDKAKMLFDAIFLRLNPFINLFDPQLHSVNYVRSKCPLLFTTLIAAGCKFFEPSLYKECLHLAHELAVRAFAEGWKRLEVVQAFACLTYWREQDENRTWMYIGYLLERRNRERTYLVLFVHDRSLSMQTGRHWMLPEDDFIRHADTWHERGGTPIRCEDVIVAAFIQLRRIAVPKAGLLQAETTDMLHTNRSQVDGGSGQVNIDMALKNANAKLSQWTTKWDHEMRRGENTSSLFLNSFGVQADAIPENRTNSHVRALSACFENALSVLQIASKEFRDLGVLRYGQETTSVMTAYSAIILLQSELPEGAAREIHATIIRTAEAYNEAAHFSPHLRLQPTMVVSCGTSFICTEQGRELSGIDLTTIPLLTLLSRDNRSRRLRQHRLHRTTIGIWPLLTSTIPSWTLKKVILQGTQLTGMAMSMQTGGGAQLYPNPTPNINDYTPADFHYYRTMLFDLGFGGEEQPVTSTNDSLRNVAYGEGVNTHYTQYPYGPTQPFGFMGS
ncbi:hypothetical protein BU15DRAFT_67851 [Melanogaster broomeanus]|nr:hypothetical protein BU15DRAFT_67851 [Melanogaster broomeanus]